MLRGSGTRALKEQSMKREEILAVIQGHVREIVPDAEGIELKEEMKMSDFGADSLDVVEVVSRTMRDLQIKVPRGDLALADDLAEVIDIFERALAQKAENAQA